jgi:hypothetical protein
MFARFERGGSLRWALPLALLFVSGPGNASPPERPSRHRVPGPEVAIYNLVGSLEVVRGEGPDVVAEVSPGGKDAGRLEIVNGEIGGRQTLRVIYPSDRIVIPEFGDHTTSTMRVKEDGTFEDSHGGRRVILSGKGPGLEAHADIRLLVPSGKKISLFWGHGKGTLSRVDSRVSLEAGGMPLTASGLAGGLHVEVGSGDIQITDSDAEISVETGSGSVRLDGIRGRQVGIETGSGEVTGKRIDAETVSIDTGSGSIEMTEVGAERATFETGSGNIAIKLDRDVQTLSLESGSGDIAVRMPRSLGAKLNVETGSGEIETDLAIQTSHRKRNELHGIVGDGRGSIDIDTGSGTVSIRNAGP